MKIITALVISAFIFPFSTLSFAQSDKMKMEESLRALVKKGPAPEIKPEAKRRIIEKPIFESLRMKEKAR